MPAATRIPAAPHPDSAPKAAYQSVHIFGRRICRVRIQIEKCKPTVLTTSTVCRNALAARLSLHFMNCALNSELMLLASQPPDNSSQFGARFDAQLAVNPREVRLDGLRADEQCG